MKYLKNVSLIFIFAGIVLVIVAFIWSFVEPYSWHGATLPFFFGLLFLPIGLLCLIIFYVYPSVLKRRERHQDQAVIKKTRTPAIAGILYIIAGLLYPFIYSNFIGAIHINWHKFLSSGDSGYILIPFILAVGPSLIGIFTGVCLLRRRFWWLSLTGAVLIFIPFTYNIIIGGYQGNGFLVYPLSALLILLFVLVLLSKAEIARRGEKQVSKGEGETFIYNSSKCPNCGSPTVDGDIIYQSKTKEEKQALGYKTKWQRVCLKCKSKWIVVEK